MSNPFESIDARLSNLEALNLEVLRCLRSVATQAPEIGGIDLAQQVTRLSKARLYALVSERSIPHSKRGNKLYFNQAELLNWLNAGRREEQKKGR